MHQTDNNPHSPETSCQPLVSNDITSNRQPVTSDHEINLFDLLLVLAKHWKMIVGVPFVVAIITGIITLFMPNIYTAKGMIIPGDDDKGGMGALMSQLGGLAGLAGVGGSKSIGDLYLTMLKSEAMKDQLINRLNLKEVYKTKFKTNIYAELDAKTVVALGKKDGVLVIMVDDKDPKWAAELANGYIEELGNLTTRLNRTTAGSNRVFIDKRLSEAKSDLDKAEEALKDFQSKNKVISVTDQAQATITGIAQIRAQVATQEVLLATLQRQFTDSSQEVKAAKASLAKLRSQLSSSESKSPVSSSIPNVGDVPQLGQDYLRLMRNYKIQEAIFEMLTKQSEMSQLNESKDVPSFQILQKATVPEKKSKPVRRKIVLIAGLVAGFLSVLVAFVFETIQKMSNEERKRWEKITVNLPKFSMIKKTKG